jgi:hypothetical protein
MTHATITEGLNEMTDTGLTRLKKTNTVHVVARLWVRLLRRSGVLIDRGIFYDILESQCVYQSSILR